MSVLVQRYPENPESQSHHNSPQAEQNYYQASTKRGRELENAERLEEHKESARQVLTDLLDLLSMKMGKTIGISDLSLEFGEIGKMVQETFNKAMNDKDEGELLINRAHFVGAKTKLLRQIDSQQ